MPAENTSGKPEGEQDAGISHRAWLPKAPLSWLRAIVPPLSRYVQQRLERLRLPRVNLSRRVIGHNRPLASQHSLAELPLAYQLVTSIANRTPSPIPGWGQPPNLVWRYQPQEQFSTIQWPNPTHPGGEISLQTPFQTLTTEERDEPELSSSASPVPAAEINDEMASRALSPQPRATAHIPPASTKPMARRTELEETGSTPPPAKQEAPRGKMVAFSVEEPAVPSRPVIKPTSEQAKQSVSRQPDASVQPPQPIARTTPPSADEKMSPLTSAPAEINPVESVPPPAVASPPTAETVAEYHPGSEITTVIDGLPPAPAPPPGTITPGPPTSIVSITEGIIRRLKTPLPGLGQQTIQKRAAPLSHITTQPILTEKGAPWRPPPSARLQTTRQLAEQSPPANTTGARENADDIPAPPTYSIDTYGEYSLEQANGPFPATPTRPQPGETASPLANREISKAETGRTVTGFTTPEAVSPVTEHQLTNFPHPDIAYRRPIQPGSGPDVNPSHPEERDQSSAPDLTFSPYLPIQSQGVFGDTTEPAWPAVRGGHDNQPAMQTTSAPVPVELSHVTSKQLASPPIQTRPYHDGQLAPELSLQRTDQSAATETPSTRSAAAAAEPAGEARPPDIDAIARDVYRLLKRRLAREKERALGLS